MKKYSEELRSFYSGRKVLVTGGQGFKGSILLAILNEFGADVRNIGLLRDDNLLFPMIEDRINVDSSEIDVRDNDAVVKSIVDFQPDVVLHLAAQPIVSVGYSDPYLTFSSNVMGTVNVLDGVRKLDKKVSVVSVTSDKAFFNSENENGYVESDLLLGHDPYSASKSAAEHVIHSFKASYFDETLGTESEKIVSAARAGNVIGGGDFSVNRLVPDMARALKAGEAVHIRNFDAMRPYEHALDAVYAYLILAAKQWDDSSLSGPYNIGPNDESLMRNGEVVAYFDDYSELKIVDDSNGQIFHETTILKLDSGKFRSTFDWEPTWASKNEILKPTFDWYSAWAAGEDMAEYTLKQVSEFVDAS